MRIKWRTIRTLKNFLKGLRIYQDKKKRQEDNYYTKNKKKSRDKQDRFEYKPFTR